MKIRNENQGSRLRLTRKVIDNAQDEHVRGKRLRLWDTEVRKLFLQITPAGSASYYLRYARADGSPNDFKLCDANVNPEEARRGALNHLAALQLDGVDPVVERREGVAAAKLIKADTLLSLIEQYNDAHPQHGDGDKSTRSYLLNRFVLDRFGHRPFREITKPEIKELVRSVQAKVAEDANQARFTGFSTANQIQSILRRMYTWAVDDREWLAQNPASFPALFEETLEPREEHFTPESFAKVWDWNVAQATGKDGRISVALATMIYLVTLQRPIDVVRAHRDHFDMVSGTWIVPKHMTKKKRKPYFIPLSPLAQRLIQTQLDRSTGLHLFPSYGKIGHICRQSLTGAFGETRDELFEDGLIPSRDLQLYDGRRFGRTVIEEDLGYPERVAEHVINHYDENHPSKRYNVRTMREKVRVAQNAWSDEIARMVGDHAFSPLPRDLV